MDKRQIIYFEIPITNREKSADFYANVFGWGVQHIPGPIPYSMLETGNVAGGLPQADAKNKIGDVLMFIDSSDIPADLKQIEEKGGKVLMPETDVPGFGKYALFNDPSGNCLALWKGNPAAQQSN